VAASWKLNGGAMVTNLYLEGRVRGTASRALPDVSARARPPAQQQGGERTITVAPALSAGSYRVRLGPSCIVCALENLAYFWGGQAGCCRSVQR
jgi:hypothetical protein